jgi:hypothetical protein
MGLTKATHRMTSGASVNVLDFGVSTSNSAAENGAAFALAMDSAKDLYIPAGTYDVTTLAVPNKRMKIVGAGVDNTILQTTSTYGVDFDHFSNTSLNRFSVLENMTIIAATGTSGLMINNAGIKARNLYIYGGDKGIYLANSVLGYYENIVTAGTSYAVYCSAAVSAATAAVVQLNKFVNFSCAPNSGTEYPYGLYVSGTVQFFRNEFTNLGCEHCSTGVNLLNPAAGLSVSSNIFINYWSEGSNVAHITEDSAVANSWINPWMRPTDAIPFTINATSLYQDQGTINGQSFTCVSGGSTNTSWGLDINDVNDAVLFQARSDGLLTTATTGALGPYNYTTAAAANLVVNSTGQLQRSTSSLKYKTNVKDAIHGLDSLLKLRPVTYKGKNDGEIVFGGLIAEEVHAAGLTEFVQYAKDGTPDALAYGQMVSLCIKAIQELKAEVEILKVP